VGEFTLLEHTADVAISASGDSLAEALAWLAAGMFSLIVDPETVASSQCQRLSVKSRDRETLAVDWLNELLYRYETTGFLPKEFRLSLAEGEAGLDAICRGEQFDPARHRILTVVKAATYHQLAVLRLKDDGRWRVHVVLDL
jgi:SHS2 domain-containing protein